MSCLAVTPKSSKKITGIPSAAARPPRLPIHVLCLHRHPYEPYARSVGVGPVPRPRSMHPRTAPELTRNSTMYARAWHVGRGGNARHRDGGGVCASAAALCVHASPCMMLCRRRCYEQRPVLLLWLVERRRRSGAAPAPYYCSILPQLPTPHRTHRIPDPIRSGLSAACQRGREGACMQVDVDQLPDQSEMGRVQ